MNLQKEHLKDLTLKHKIYHPFLGEGKIVEIKEDSVKIQFKYSTKKFETTGTLGETRFITELYLQPIKIIVRND
jgi:hypothetical protein